MNSYTFLNLINDVLENVRKPLSEKEIWEYAVKLMLDKKVKSKGKTPWKTIAARIYVDIRDNNESPYIKIGRRPTRFYLKKYLVNEDEKNHTQKIETVEKEIETKKAEFTERDFHPYW